MHRCIIKLSLIEQKLNNELKVQICEYKSICYHIAGHFGHKKECKFNKANIGSYNAKISLKIFTDYQYQIFCSYFTILQSVQLIAYMIQLS